MPSWFFAVFALSASANPTAAAPKPVDYLVEIKPLLAARCYACHGGLQQKAGLRADSAKALVAAGAAWPGKGAESPLIAHLLGRGDHARMPPTSEGEALSTSQVALVRRWIDEGAVAPAQEAIDPDPREHWAFRAPRRPSLPATVAHGSNPIDRFLAAEWAKRGLAPQPAADKRSLLRRIYLDLTGLPPTVEEAEAFVRDAAPDAYERVVDGLLASPRYGERWGRHFLDLWRYSDQWGLGTEVRNSQKHMWHWRDWAVESFNADIGYDEMIRQLLAADELYPTDPDKLRATGYLARQYFIFNRTTWMDETIEHTAKAFLGLTLNCAKCHDHKFDPVSQTDYYRFRAFFEPYQVRTDMVPGEADFEKDGLPRAFDCNADAPTYKHVRGDDRNPLTSTAIPPGVPSLLSFGGLKIVPIALPAEAHSPHTKPFVGAAYMSAAKGEGELALAAVRERAEADRLKAAGLSDRFREAARRASKAEKVHALARAVDNFLEADEALAKADEKDKATLAKKRDAARIGLAASRKASEKLDETYAPLRGARKAPESNLETEASRTKPFPTTSTGRRTALAGWIADPRNPLTSRVLVNNVWARHFGRPLAATTFDFGRKGAKPTNPELLDWLAVEFVENGWSIKQLHRTIVTSRAYRMTSSSAGAAPANEKIDGENAHLWRRNPVRMEAQVVRDSLLHLAGRLDLAVGGPSVPPALQDVSRRRSLYFFQSHNEHNKFLAQFDDASVLECYRRTESIVPQQALTLANSMLAMTAADAIAVRLMGLAGPGDDAAFVALAFRSLLGSDPTADESAACLRAMAEWKAELLMQNHADPARKARINLVGSLVNHNDFVTVR